MKKLIVTLGAAVIGSAVLAAGALADDKSKSMRAVATGYTFCDTDKVAVFPATNISKHPIKVRVSCSDIAGNELNALGSDSPPGKTEIDPGGAAIVAGACGDVTGLGGDLVRCTVKGREDSLTRVRGVLHICEDLGDLGLGNCDLTEALLFADDDDDDD